MKEPSISETAFSCPHCGTYTTQYWHVLLCDSIRKNGNIPFMPRKDDVRRVESAKDMDPDTKEVLLERFGKMQSGLVFTDRESGYSACRALHNAFASQCYNCKKWALWIHEDIVYPPTKFGGIPNEDLPTDVAAVVEEARGIISLSPRGGAALLRLAIQMLCKHLGESGENLNADIASLVKKGLNPVIQKSLDVVRVIGNESVHPGSIDLNDDKDTAIRLFDLVNIIAEQMITQPKHVDELYAKLPESKREAIEKRDASTSDCEVPK